MIALLVVGLLALVAALLCWFACRQGKFYDAMAEGVNG